MGIEQEFWAAFIEAQKAMPVIGKNRTATIETRGGGSYSYRFADLNDVIAAVSPVLHANNLAFVQAAVSNASGVGVTTTIAHANGYTVSFGELILASGDDARAAGSALTYARRYSLLAALGLSADTDDDGAQVSDVRSHASEGTGGSSAGPTPSYLDDDYVCPVCGSPVQNNLVEHFKDNQKPAFRCGNRACQGGGAKKQGGGNWPWATWDANHFKSEDEDPDAELIREDFDPETGELWPPGQEPFE